jgi:transcriptional regulator with XRE-family HTH domain
MANERLRSAMAKAQTATEAITKATGVDPKTVQRWLAGRVPHHRHRWAIANLLGEDEGYLWPAARPDLSPGAEATPEVVAAYGHRADIPNTTRSDLLATARRQIDLLGYAFLFLPEQLVDLGLSIEKKGSSPASVGLEVASIPVSPA